MISITGALNVIWVLLVIGVLYILLEWGINKADPPQPIRKVCELVLVILIIALCIAVLFSLVSGTPIFRP